MVIIFAKGLRFIPPTRIKNPRTIGQKIAKFQNRSISSVVREWNNDGQIRMNKSGSLTKSGREELAKEKLRLGLLEDASTDQYCKAYSTDIKKRLDEALKENEQFLEQQRIAAMQPFENVVITI